MPSVHTILSADANWNFADSVRKIHGTARNLLKTPRSAKSQSVISFFKNIETTSSHFLGFPKHQSLTGVFVDIQKLPRPALIRKSQTLTGLFVSTPNFIRKELAQHTHG